MTTQAELDRLKKAYRSGVLKIREGDTWIEYQSMRQMKLAIDDMEAELAGYNKPRGTRVARTSKGY